MCQDVTVVVDGAVAWTGQTSALRERPGPFLLSTSDDRAMSCAAAGATVSRRPEGGLAVHASTGQLDAYVLALASAGVAVRELVRESLPLEQAFLELVR